MRKEERCYPSLRTVVTYVPGLYTGYTTTVYVTPHRLALFFMVLNVNGAVLAATSLLLYGSSVPMINALTLEPCVSSAKSCPMNAYMVGVGTQAYTGADFAFIAAMKGSTPASLLSSWAYRCTQQSQFNDVITEQNSAGTYDVFASGSQSDNALLLKLVNGKIFAQLTIYPPADQFILTCQLMSISAQIRTTCTIMGYIDNAYFNKIVVFNVDRLTLQPGKLPLGYTWSKENSFITALLSVIGATGAVVTPIAIDQSIVMTVPASLAPTSLPTTLTTVAPSPVLSRFSSLSPSNRDMLNSTRYPSALPTTANNPLNAISTSLPTIIVVKILQNPSVQPTPVSSLGIVLKSVAPTLNLTNKPPANNFSVSASSMPSSKPSSKPTGTVKLTDKTSESFVFGNLFMGVLCVGGFTTLLLAYLFYSYNSKSKLKKIHVERNSAITIHSDLESNTSRIDQSNGRIQNGVMVSSTSITINHAIFIADAPSMQAEENDSVSSSDLSEWDLSSLDGFSDASKKRMQNTGANAVFSVTSSEISDLISDLSADSIEGLNYHEDLEENRRTTFNY